jgi:hypothetical protein
MKIILESAVDVTNPKFFTTDLTDLLIFMLDLQWIQLSKLKNKTHYIFTYWVKQQTSKSPLQISKISVISGSNC